MTLTFTAYLLFLVSLTVAPKFHLVVMVVNTLYLTNWQSCCFCLYHTSFMYKIQFFCGPNIKKVFGFQHEWFVGILVLQKNQKMENNTWYNQTRLCTDILIFASSNHKNSINLLSNTNSNVLDFLELWSWLCNVTIIRLLQETDICSNCTDWLTVFVKSVSVKLAQLGRPRVLFCLNTSCCGLVEAGINSSVSSSLYFSRTR